MATGIRTRHARNCASRSAGRCNCSPSYEAWVYSAREQRKIRKSFPNVAEAKGWRGDASSAVRKGTMKSPTTTTLEAAGEAWLEGARAGTIRNRSGDRYKPSAIRSYEASLRLRLVPVLGHRRLSDIHRTDLQDLADKLVAKGVHASTVQCSLLPLRAIYRRALARGEVALNPTQGLELPAVRGRRERIADPAEAAKLIAAIPERDRALWATAMYAGLRRGELMALRWEEVDLKAGVIHVTRSWDAKEGVIDPKSSTGKRKVPIPSDLRRHLLEHRMRSAHVEGLVFGVSPLSPFGPGALTQRARKAWDDAGLDRITLHEARHTFASLMIAAGVNAKALSTFMGHANISITLDRYGHLFPGSETEAAGLLDAYLERAVAAPTA
jgi:integrase